MRLKVLLLFVLCSLMSYAQFQKSYFSINGNQLPYQVSYPKDYDASKQYPLLVFLHGAGERGVDNEKQLTHGQDFLLQCSSGDNAAIVIAPQCPSDSYWSSVKASAVPNKERFSFGLTTAPTATMEALTYLINDWATSGVVDSKRIYVGGLSMGGMGTLELLWRMPNTFAAAFVICGAGDTSKAQFFGKTTAVWLFHGGEDNVVLPQYSRDMHEALKKVGADVVYTEYPDANHNSWDSTFQETRLIPWLFSHSK